jgi:pilus assembly protein CpaB
MRRTLLAITAVLLATVGTALLYVYVASADSRAQQGIQTRNVLVATRNIPAGISAAQVRDYVTTKSMPAFGLADNVLSDLGREGAKVLTVPVVTGEQITDQMFGAVSTSGLSPGNVGVSVQIGDANRVVSLLKPGSMVGVFQLSAKGLTEILPKAKVLAVSGAIITFDLSQAQARALLVASADAAGGTLTLEILTS